MLSLMDAVIPVVLRRKYQRCLPPWPLIYVVFGVQSCMFYELYYLLTNWLAYLYGRIQSPRPDVMPDRREGITRAAGFGFAFIDTQAS